MPVRFLPWKWLTFGSDESDIVSVYAAGPEDVDDAVAAARKAFKNPDWRDMDTNARADLLYKFAHSH